MSPEAAASAGETFRSGKRVDSWADESESLDSLEISASFENWIGDERSRGERSECGGHQLRANDEGAALLIRSGALGSCVSSGYRLGTKIGKGEFVPVDALESRNSTMRANCFVQLGSTVPRCVRRRRRSVGCGSSLAAAARRKHVCEGTQHTCTCICTGFSIDESMRGHFGSSIYRA